jgi:hypothetical protein
LSARKEAQKFFDHSNHFVQGLVKLECRAFENAGGGDGESRQAATASLYPMLEASSSTVAHHVPLTDTGSPMDESMDGSYDGEGVEEEEEEEEEKKVS